MGLLDKVPKRLPVVGGVYWLSRDYYDPSDQADHPQLVISLDRVRRVAITVSRTSKEHAAGRMGVSHPKDDELGLSMNGWWRLHRPHRVPFSAFDDEEVEMLGRLDEGSMVKVQDVLAPKGPEVGS